MNLTPIPVTDYGFIDYQSKVLLIKPDNSGNDADYQADGTACRQCSVRGFIIKDFLVDYRWFKEDWWYKRTRWYENDNGKSNILFFCPRKIQRIVDKTNTDEWFSFLDKLIEEVKPSAIPVEKILSRIMDYASKKMNLKLIPDFDDYTYGEHWYESYIPVKDI